MNMKMYSMKVGRNSLYLFHDDTGVAFGVSVIARSTDATGA